MRGQSQFFSEKTHAIVREHFVLLAPRPISRVFHSAKSDGCRRAPPRLRAAPSGGRLPAQVHPRLRAPRQPLCRRPKRAGSLPSGCLRRDGLGGGTSTQGGRRDASRRRGRLRPRRPPLLRRGARPTSSSSVSASRQRRSREASSGVLTLLLGRRVPCQPRAGVASGVTVGLASRRPKSAPRAPSSRIHLAARGALGAASAGARSL